MRTLANGNRRVVWVPFSKFADPSDPKATEVAAANDITCDIVQGTLTLGPTDSDTTDEASLCDTAKGAAITFANYEGSFTAFRDYDEKGQPTDADILKIISGQPVGYLVDLPGKPVKTTKPAPGDEVWIYGGRLDYPKLDANEGSIKVGVKLVPSGEVYAPTTLS